MALSIVFSLTTTPAIAAEKELKVGCAVALSGPVSVVGHAFKNGAQLVADYYNQKGGLRVGEDTFKITIIEADTKFTPEGSITAARRLVEREKVHMMLGPIATPQYMAVQSVTEPARIPILHTASADVAIKDKKYTFRAYIPVRETLPGIFNWLEKNRPKVKKLALFDMDYESGYFGHKLAQKMADIKGFNVVYDGYYDPGTKDFNSYLLKILSKKPDAIFNTQSPYPEWAIIIKQARELGFKGLFIEATPPAVADNKKIAGLENLQGLVGFGYTTEGDLVPQGLKDFRKQYVEKYGDWSAHSLVMTPAIYGFFGAVEKAGSLNPDKIVKVLESGDEWKTPLGITGIFGGSETYGAPRQWLAPVWVMVVKGDKAIPVAEIPIVEMKGGWE